MSNQVPEWVHYGDGIGAIIVDYASKGIVLFTIFGLPILFFVVWAIDSNTYHKRQLAADEVTKLKKNTKAGARFERNCVDRGIDYALYIWMVDEIKKDLDEMGYYELCVDIALIHLPISIEIVFGGTSLYDRAVKMFESQKDYFRDTLCCRI